VDLQAALAKLRERALRLVMELGAVSRPRARRLLAVGGSVRVANRDGADRSVRA